MDATSRKLCPFGEAIIGSHWSLIKRDCMPDQRTSADLLHELPMPNQLARSPSKQSCNLPTSASGCGRWSLGRPGGTVRPRGTVRLGDTVRLEGIVRLGGTVRLGGMSRWKVLVKWHEQVAGTPSASPATALPPHVQKMPLNHL